MNGDGKDSTMSNRVRSLTIVLVLVAGSRPLAAQESAAVSALESKGQSLLQQGRATEAIKAYEVAVEQARKEYGVDHERTLQVQSRLGLVLLAAGRLDDGVKVCEKVAAGAEAKYGPNHPQTYVTLCDLGKVYKTAKRNDDAINCLKRSLKGLEATLAPNHIIIIEVVDLLIETCVSAGRYVDAETYLRRKITILEAKHGPDHPDAVTAKIRVSVLMMSTNRLADAAEYLRAALDGLKARAGADEVQIGRLLNEVAKLEITKGRYADAEKLLGEARAILAKKRGPEAPETWKVLGGLGLLYMAKGEFAEAERLLRECVKKTEDRFGLANSDTLEAYSQLSALLGTTGRTDEATELLGKALAAYERSWGANHPMAISLRAVIAKLGNTKGPKFAPPSREAMDRTFAKGSTEAALLFDALRATELAEAGRFTEAEPLQKQSLATLEKALGADHPGVGVLQMGLSTTYTFLGRYQEAENCARRALRILDAKFGSDHPHTAQCRGILALSLVALHRAPEALDLLDVECRSWRRILERSLPALSERDQLALLRATNSNYDIAMGMTCGLRNSLGWPAHSASWILNHKALAFAALAERSILARASADPHVAEIVARLNETRGRLATMASPAFQMTLDRAGPRKQIEQLVAKEHEISRELSLTLKGSDPGDSWVELDQVRGALPSDAVLIEFARYVVGNRQHKRWACYLAWVIPPADRGNVRLIDLGESGPIDEAIANVRGAMRLDRVPNGREGDAAPGTDQRSGLTRPDVNRNAPETESEKRVIASLEALGRLILGPLRPYIDRSPRWVLSPDSSLWLVPWQALRLDGGRYAIERHLIHLVVSGRELVSPAGTNSTAPPVIFADPDFDLGGSLDGMDSAPSAFHVSRLPGTAIEADQVAPRLAQYAGAAPEVYKQAEATEARFRALRRPSVLILSTHGFFLDQSEPSSSARLPENPLLRCGLLLAGANQRRAAAAAGGDSSGLDGVLTGLEIVGADLQGTGLVVLSACETGLGQVQSGEGVAGLRQSFQLAGARSLVATLWQIPDAESAQLMTGFFSKLSAGLGPASALRRAQLEQISAPASERCRSSVFLGRLHSDGPTGCIVGVGARQRRGRDRLGPCARRRRGQPRFDARPQPPSAIESITAGRIRGARTRPERAAPRVWIDPPGFPGLGKPFHRRWGDAHRGRLFLVRGAVVVAERPTRLGLMVG